MQFLRPKQGDFLNYLRAFAAWRMDGASHLQVDWTGKSDQRVIISPS